MIEGYPKCYQCECQINLIDVNGTYICHKHFKELERLKNMVNAQFGREIYGKSKVSSKSRRNVKC
jgi:hypothetical protein